MNMFRISLLSAAVLTMSATLLTACGGGGDDSTPTTQPAAQTESVSGTAATGKPFVGTVVVVNKDGKESAAVTIAADGTFKVDVPKGAPYLIKASNGKAGESLVELYSYLADASKHVNVTQLTTQALYDANQQKKIADLYAQWAVHHADLTTAEVELAAKKVAANLKAQLSAAGLNPKAVNIFNDVFKANSTGLDKVLDQVQISYNCNVSSCNVNYTVNGFAFTWNYTVDTTGYNVSVTPGTPLGSYDLKVTTNVAGVPSDITIHDVPKPATQAEFCADGDVKDGLPSNITINSCTFSGNKGAINATVTTPQGLSINYTVNYEYVPAA